MSDSESSMEITIEDLKAVKKWKPAKTTAEKVEQNKKLKLAKRGTTEAQREARMKALEKAREVRNRNLAERKSAEALKNEAAKMKAEAEERLKEVSVIKDQLPKMSKMLEDLNAEKQMKKAEKSNIFVQQQQAITKKILQL
jgi:hypothetical protein